MFHQLWQNLISNSLKYRQLGIPPKIQIGYECIIQDLQTSSTATHQLTFSDNGIGFDPAFGQRVIQLFQRLHGHAQYNGTGIGLAICHRIMQNHKGSITAEGMPNQGATFTLHWPVREGPFNQ